MADTGVMQPPHKNGNLLFKNFLDFLVRSQHPFKKNEFLFIFVGFGAFRSSATQKHLDSMAKRKIPHIAEDLPSKSSAGRQR